MKHAGALAAIVALGCAATFLTPISVTDVDAKSRACRSLERQMDGAGGGKSAQFRKFDKAVKAQIKQLKKTERAHRRARCSSRGGNQCGRLENVMGKMRKNLARLKSKRDRYAGGGKSRRAILAKMRRQGCLDEGGTREASTPKRQFKLSDLFKPRSTRNRERDTALASTQNKTRSRPNRELSLASKQSRDSRKTLRERLFKDREVGGEVVAGEERAITITPSLAWSGGTYRTMCVRVSDGYYFPISFSTSQERFPIDEAHCQRMCPGSEAQLYLHKMPGQAVEEMVSYRGNFAYKAQPFAFQYRKNFDPKISCNFEAASSSGLIEVAGGNGGFEEPDVTKAKVSEPTAPRIGLPVYRQDRGLDPEHQQNADGGLDLDAIKLAAERRNKVNPVAALNRDSTGREIRAVGPRFFPVQ